MPARAAFNKAMQECARSGRKTGAEEEEGGGGRWRWRWEESTAAVVPQLFGWDHGITVTGKWSCFVATDYYYTTTVDTLCNCNTLG